VTLSYYGLVAATWIGWFYFSVTYGSEAAVQAKAWFLKNLWSPTGDPVLNVIIDSVLVVVGLAVMVGIFISGLVLILLSCIIGLIAYFIIFAVWAGEQIKAMSVTGVIVWYGFVGITSFVVLRWFFQKYGSDIIQAVSPVVVFVFTPLMSVFSRMQAAPVGNIHGGWKFGANTMKRKGSEEKKMDEIDQDNLRAMWYGKVKEIFEHLPDAPALPKMDVEYGGWWLEVKKQFDLWVVNKTTQETVELARLVNTGMEEWLKYIKSGVELLRLEKTEKLHAIQVERDIAELEYEKAQWEHKKKEFDAVASGDEKMSRAERIEKELRKRVGEEKDVDVEVAKLQAAYADDPEMCTLIKKKGKELKSLIRDGRLEF